MRNILDLIRRDLRHAVRNVMAIIVMAGLVLIPSLFTWFNVIASWDPFGNTGSLKVAVASTDTGYKSDLVPLRVNVGEQVLSALRANDDLDWVITTKDDAVDGTRSGEYYAAIVLPPSFSADMMTFYAADAERTRIDVYTNEKKNALAPKITGQGAEGVSSQIGTSFARTLGDVALALISSMSDYLSDADTQAALTRVEARLGDLSARLRSGGQTADMFARLMESSVPLARGASSLVAAGGEAFADTSDAVGGGVQAAATVKSTLEDASRALAEALAATAGGYDAVARQVEELFTAAGASSAAQAQALGTLSARVQQQIDRYATLRSTVADEVAPRLPASAQPAVQTVIARLDEAIARQQAVRDRLDQAQQDLATGTQTWQGARQGVTDAIAEAKRAIEGAARAYDEGLRTQLDRLSATLATVGADVSAVREDLSGASSRLSGSSGSVLSALTSAQTTAQQLAASLRTAADTVGEVQRAVAKAADTGDLSEISKVIGPDPGVLATSLAEPVRVDRVAVFPVVSFGAGMAPLYTVLALWVGALLMTVTIRVDVDDDVLPGRAVLTPTQRYLGRYGIFALTGLAQSTLLTLGLIVFVQVEPAHPLLLVLAGWVISFVFTLVIYTAVVAFGNAGKALSVLLLVIQISGSGGAYPLQLLPAWFQGISPFLPATYAVGALRSAIAGDYQGDFWVSSGTLALFVLPALLLGLVLRRPLIAVNRGLVEALESTKLM